MLCLDEKESSQCQYDLLITLSDGNDRLIDQAVTTGIVPGGEEDIQRLGLNDSQITQAAADTLYKLRLDVSYDGITRSYLSQWNLS
ncbi:hypothetical protein D3C78_1741060 [compost metagenome]